MCLKCDKKQSELRRIHRSGATGDRCGDHQARAGHRAGRRYLEPVCAARLRDLLERTVLVGLGPQLFPNQPADRRTVLLSDSGRGGADRTFVRQVAIYLSHVSCGLSYAQAASLYERHRTTAAHACSIVEDRRDDTNLDQILGLLDLCVRAEFSRVDPRLAHSMSNADKPKAPAATLP
jgi:hypothetical protein